MLCESSLNGRKKFVHRSCAIPPRRGLHWKFSSIKRGIYMRGEIILMAIYTILKKNASSIVRKWAQRFEVSDNTVMKPNVDIFFPSRLVILSSRSNNLKKNRRLWSIKNRTSGDFGVEHSTDWAILAIEKFCKLYNTIVKRICFCSIWDFRWV